MSLVHTPDGALTIKMHPITFSCPEPDCYTHIGCDTEAALSEIKRTHTHTTPKRGWIMDEVDADGKPYTAVHYGKSILEKIWDELDRTIDQIREDMPKGMQNGTVAHEQELEAREYLKYEARGLSYAILQMSFTHYKTVEDILKESMKRWKIRKGLIDFDPTPGYQFNPPPPGSDAWIKSVKDSMGQETPKRVAKKSSSPKRITNKKTTVDPKTIPGLKKAIGGGMFDVNTYAKAFGLDPADVQAAFDS